MQVVDDGLPYLPWSQALAYFMGISYQSSQPGWNRRWTARSVTKPIGLDGGLPALNLSQTLAYVSGISNQVQYEDSASKAARSHTNEYGIEELLPIENSSRCMEHQCRVMGSMPFMWTCSNRINVLVQEAARTYANGINKLRPTENSNSWMERQCGVLCSMPFMYTCFDGNSVVIAHSS